MQVRTLEGLDSIRAFWNCVITHINLHVECVIVLLLLSPKMCTQQWSAH